MLDIIGNIPNLFMQSVTVTIADACPGCPNGNSMDLSEGAFEKIADLSEGIVASEFELSDILQWLVY